MRDIALSLHSGTKGYSIMGSMFENEKQSAKQTKRCLRSKGDRLGWKSRSEVENKPLREIIGRAEVVSVSYCFMSCSYKLIP